MRIAFIGQKGIPVSQGGVERHVEELSCALAKRGHEVLAYSRSTYLIGDAKLPQGVKVVTLPSIPVKAWDTIIATLFATIDVLFRKVDVIHYHSLGPAFFMFLPWFLKPSTTLVFTHHTYETQRPQWGPLARFAMRCGEAVGMALADEVVAISPVVAMDLEAIYRRHVSMVPNGFTNLPVHAITHQVLPEKYILAVSRLIRSKGLDFLINAFHLIEKDFPNYHLVIVGSATHNDSDEARLRSLANGSHRIHFLGWQPSSKLGAIYRGASLFVQPSEIEGLPMTLLEAATTGVPIIVSDIPEHMLIVRADAPSFKSKHHLDLASKLRLVLGNEEKYRERSALLAERVIRDFDWQYIAKRIENIYMNSAERRKLMVQKLA